MTYNFLKKHLFILAGSVLFTLQIFAQRTKTKQTIKKAGNETFQIPMKPAYWEYDTSAAEFTTYKNTDVVKGKNGRGYQVFLKNHIFTNGTIEFDVELSGMGFPGINFRMSEDKKRGENFYIRSFGPVKP